MEIKSNVTVIIPCYNDGKYIMKALQSIYVQTVLPERIIIVDDGSGQETKNVLKNIKHSSVEIIYQENKGVSNARNTAIALAKTDYILNLDADDYFEPSFIEKSVGVLNNNLKIGVVGCFYKALNKNVIENEITKPLGGKAKDFLIKNNGLGNSMFRKKCWVQVSGYDEKMANGYEDWEFWIAILKNDWEMYIIQEPLFIYRRKTISRDQTALKDFDFELRSYIFLKHEQVFLDNYEFYTLELLRQNSLLRNKVIKTKNSKDYKIGEFFLVSLRFLKKTLNLK
jgi:glycosyltransferase involved in cell wall biosynthesis